MDCEDDSSCEKEWSKTIRPEPNVSLKTGIRMQSLEFTKIPEKNGPGTETQNECAV